MLSFEEIEDCLPSGAKPKTDDGCVIVSNKWLHDFAHAVAAKEREACARVCELRGRALEAARAHADGSLQGANPRYWGPLILLAAELGGSIRERSNGDIKGRR